ncbi:MAG: response regulator transcription factor [Crocinitomicaceae bacterium]|nr:response regulator transcription factor [Crocinitomicaceae bacterium]
MKQTILIIDDEMDIRKMLRYNLENSDYSVLEAENGIEGIEIAQRSKPDLILLDVMMPGIDGIEVCERIKNIPELSNVVVCILSARGEDYSQLAGFEAGADDYITKPIKPKLLVSKINAILRRTSPKTDESEFESLPQDANIQIDFDQYLVIKDGKEIVLPRKEFELLALLMSKQGRVFKRTEIMNRVWGTDVIVGDRTIDVHIRKLRKKIGDDHIQTIKGVGYKFIY